MRKLHNILITGGAGFIGSNLCEAILEKGCKVKSLDDLSTGKQENVDLFKDNPNYTFIKGDIQDLDTCMKACEGVDSFSDVGSSEGSGVEAFFLIKSG